MSDNMRLGDKKLGADELINVSGGGHIKTDDDMGDDNMMLTTYGCPVGDGQHKWIKLHGNEYKCEKCNEIRG